MSLTRALNSKANIKQYSSADLPINSRQPVLAKYEADTTASQTVINLPFMVDTVNAADSFFLFIDGRLLDRGSADDYTFTAVDALGFSSQVTLTLSYSLSAGLSIQAFKMGLKKESEFAQDNRFVDLYDGMDKGFQAFVSENSRLSATSTTGSPASGYFHSTVSNRASIPDLSADLKARMGVERFSGQQLIEVPDEFGPNGERVYTHLNDSKNLVRFVGAWNNNLTTAGPGIQANSATDYVEITFYGTGLNWLMINTNDNRSWQIAVDGVNTTTVSTTTSNSTIINARNYSPNTIMNVASGLTLGVHTVKISIISGAALWFFGYEVINEASTIKVQPGTSYNSGKRLISASQQSLAYNSGFTNVYGTAGTKGGHVLVYQASDGTIKKDVRYTETSVTSYPSAVSHANEEIIRKYNFREFGSGRSDDFSTLVSTARSAGFTLDDGTTNLACDQAFADSVNAVGGFKFFTGTYQEVHFTFVGTGLDVVWKQDTAGTNSNANSFVYSVDNGADANWPTTGAGSDWMTIKLVSGLPYGTHVIKFKRGSPNVWNLALKDFIVYGPKKPTLPSGAVELADYFLTADYVINSTNGGGKQMSISTGVIAKSISREMLNIGTGTSLDSVYWNGSGNQYAELYLGSTGAWVMQYSFFGTGFEFDARGSNGWVVNIDGVNYTGSATAVGTTSTWTGGTSTFLSSDDAADCASKLSVTGLSLGFHTVKFTSNSPHNVRIRQLNVITPIHAPKSDLYADLQNTLSVGNCSLSDNRSLTPVRDVSSKKAWAQAVGTVSDPTVTATSFIPMPDMSLTIKTSGGPLQLSFTGDVAHNNQGSVSTLQFYLNGFPVENEHQQHCAQTSHIMVRNLSCIIPAAPGTHKVDVYWKVNGATATGSGTRRVLTVREL